MNAIAALVSLRLYVATCGVLDWLSICDRVDPRPVVAGPLRWAPARSVLEATSFDGIFGSVYNWNIPSIIGEWKRIFPNYLLWGFVLKINIVSFNATEEHSSTTKYGEEGDGGGGFQLTAYNSKTILSRKLNLVLNDR